MPVRSHAAAHAATPAVTGGAPPEPRLSILPPGERERRRARPDRRRAERRTRDLGAPYGAERRSGLDDRQADRRDRSKRAAGIGLMRDYFSHGEAAASRPPAGRVAPTHD